MTCVRSPALRRRRHWKAVSVWAPAIVLEAGHLSLLVCLALLFAAGGAMAQPTVSQSSAVMAMADQEPITPIPLPPAADPEKLALGERLFGDPRLSEAHRCPGEPDRGSQLRRAGVRRRRRGW